MPDLCPDWPSEFGSAAGAAAGGGLPAGLDWQALLDGLAWGGYLAGCDEDRDAVAAEEAGAWAEGRMRPADPGWVAALAVEHMEAGPALSGWLEVAAAAAGRLDENALAALAVGAAKLTSRAQAAGLAAAAQIASRAAAADRRVGVAADGRPARLCRDGVTQIMLALRLTECSASSWMDLAVGLGWRLTATRRALAAGVIDYWRARAIFECTSVLSAEAARKVEAKLLPQAAGLSVPDLRERLRLAVIAVDPEGAEERRKAAERHADVRLYGEDDQTSSIVMDKLPQVAAAAAFALVNALARARKAAGMPGSLGWHRAQVGLGLWLGTLPLIPPAQSAPPGQPPGDGPGNGAPGDGGPGGGGPDGGGPDGGGPDGGGPDGGGPGGGGPPPPGDLPAPRDEDAPPEDGLDEPGDAADAGSGWDPVEDDGQDRGEDDEVSGARAAPAWPALGAIPPGLARPARPDGRVIADGRPVPGLLDVLVPWVTLAGAAGRPGLLGRIGPITAAQARQLAGAAMADPGTQWRVIVTNAAGQAITVARIRRRRACDHQVRDGPGPPGGRCPPGAGLVGRLTVTITEDTVREQARRLGGPLARGSPGGPGPPGGMAAAVVRAAARALDQAEAQAAADAAAGGCAHHGESKGYRPPPRLREQVIARDVTCRGPVCRQPAWRADLDHTLAYDQGGRTCRCNLGGTCRRDHQLKQHPRWKLEQTRPGYFTWTTPAGRSYTVGPDTHPI
jgi:hypothetical protein